MATSVKRGFSPNDKRDFGSNSIDKLLKAGHDLQYLLNHDYCIKGASAFVGNHYLLSERQRLAIVRAVSSNRNVNLRKNKEVKKIPQGCVVNIDGFNTIITLEVALSGSVLLRSMDGTIRDLAALRGTYRLIDKTDRAIVMIGEILEKNKIKAAVFYLDAQVSNSGRLKQRINEILNQYTYEVYVEVINNVDAVLKTLDNVVSSDSIILNECNSWINLNALAIEEIDRDYQLIDFSEAT